MTLLACGAARLVAVAAASCFHTCRSAAIIGWGAGRARSDETRATARARVSRSNNGLSESWEDWRNHGKATG